jgi:hypothetical protein
MAALPSLPVIASRTAPVALFVIVMRASFSTAPVWSVTTTIMAPVFGDCAGNADTSNANIAARHKDGRRDLFLFMRETS